MPQYLSPTLSDVAEQKKKIKEFKVFSNFNELLTACHGVISGSLAQPSNCMTKVQNIDGDTSIHMLTAVESHNGKKIKQNATMKHIFCDL